MSNAGALRVALIPCAEKSLVGIDNLAREGMVNRVIYGRYTLYATVLVTAAAATALVVLSGQYGANAALSIKCVHIFTTTLTACSVVLAAKILYDDTLLLQQAINSASLRENLGNSSAMITLPEYLRIPESDAQFLLPKIAENAFEMREKHHYWYQGTDIHAILQSRLLQEELRHVHLIQPMQQNELEGRLDEILEETTEQRPTLSILNLGDLHWVAFALIRQNDGSVTAWYKDSLGNRNQKFEALFQQKGAVFISINRGEQRDDSSCGIMALQNLRIFAKELKANPGDGSRDRYKALEFCTQDEAENLRENEFPHLYQEGFLVQEICAEEEQERREAIRAALYPEVQKAARQLKSVISDTTQVEAVQEGEIVDWTQKMGTIGIEVRLDEQGARSHLLIFATADITMENLESVVQKVFGEYRVMENGICIESSGLDHLHATM